MAEEVIKDPGTVTFNDVAVYFSFHQWELLEDWQKLLYKNVMKEIHGALTALGYEIANPGVLVKVQQSDEPSYSRNNKEEIKYKGPSQIRPDILLRVKMEEAFSDRSCQTCVPKEEEELELREEEEEEEEEFSTDSSAAVFNPELSLWIKQEDEPGDQSSSMDDVIDVTPSRAPITAGTPGGTHNGSRSSNKTMTVHKRNGLKLRDKILVLCGYANSESVGTLATQFGVSKSQIMQIIKRREELIAALQNNVSGDRIRRQRRTTNDKLNSTVWEWLLSTRDSNVTLSGRIIREKALEIASQLGIRDFKASNGWLDSFKKAHNIQRCSAPFAMASFGNDRLDDWLCQMSAVDEH
ncbi:zinc finger protein 135 isoform X3 [Xenopus laevis]|uniref:Zinc finger protein 135 isoform X3 n=1 Tax=Xenopus laevis TaxID=8355 RepID=A0A8J0VDY8_XENLA|nr:zinc finger protein 135 isoform X3 [Xenopus laevis]